ncbi:hypothetical protein FRC07_002711 [Ceratobasidium sp. 392]|nr:hypothetical protein FRC07_002711 [Ceratobasidium sp. 392]
MALRHPNPPRMRAPCNCKRCKLKKDHPPDVIAKHLALYGVHKPIIDNSENALMDNTAGPSRQRSGSLHGSRGTPRRFVPLSPGSLPHVPLSPAPGDAATHQDDTEMVTHGSAGYVSRSSSLDLDASPGPVSPLLLAQEAKNMDANRRETNGRTYRTARAGMGPAQPFDNPDDLRKRLHNLFGREDTPDAIVPDSPGQITPPNPDAHVQDTGYIEPARYRSVSAVPTLADAPPLPFAWSQSDSRPNSVAGDNNELALDFTPLCPRPGREDQVLTRLRPGFDQASTRSCDLDRALTGYWPLLIAM